MFKESQNDVNLLSQGAVTNELMTCDQNVTSRTKKVIMRYDENEISKQNCLILESIENGLNVSEYISPQVLLSTQYI